MSINPKELRVNNWLLDPEGTPRQVAYVGETIGLYSNAGVTDKYQHPPIISYSIEALNPMPIPPKILKSVGFKQHEGSIYVYVLDDPKFELVVHSPGVYRACKTTTSWAERIYKQKIQYLHQLQNCVFAHTGLELKIDLTTKIIL